MEHRRNEPPLPSRSAQNALDTFDCAPSAYHDANLLYAFQHNLFPSFILLNIAQTVPREVSHLRTGKTNLDAHNQAL